MGYYMLRIDLATFWPVARQGHDGPTWRHVVKPGSEPRVGEGDNIVFGARDFGDDLEFHAHSTVVGIDKGIESEDENNPDDESRTECADAAAARGPQRRPDAAG